MKRTGILILASTGILATFFVLKSLQFSDERNASVCNSKITSGISNGDEKETCTKPRKKRRRRKGRRAVSYKPVIYTYSQQAKALTLTLDPVGEFTFTYPEYTKNWYGTANPDGSFTTDGKNYPYLFWEGNSDHLTQLQDFSEGFIVEKENVIRFLEQQLTEIGFNDKERTDFITFWGPRMAQSEKGIARFLVNEAYNKLVADLNVSPKPDHVYRLYLLWTPINNTFDQEITPQQLPKLKRGGLTIVEWGGSEIPVETVY